MDINDPLVEAIFAALKKGEGNPNEKYYALQRAGRIASTYVSADAPNGAFESLFILAEADRVPAAR
jgi:hypothetical protein